MVNAPNIPRTPSPLFQSSARLPEFGEDGRIPPTIDTPASTTAELGHQTEASPVAAAQDLPLLATNVANPTTEELDWEFAFGDPDVIDHSPPERPPTPVSLVHLAACHCPAPNGHMSMGIKCGPCSIYDSITAASLHGTEVCPLFFLFFVAPVLNQSFRIERYLYINICIYHILVVGCLIEI